MQWPRHSTVNSIRKILTKTRESVGQKHCSVPQEQKIHLAAIAKSEFYGNTEHNSVIKGWIITPSSKLLC